MFLLSSLLFEIFIEWGYIFIDNALFGQQSRISIRQVHILWKCKLLKCDLS